MGHWFDRIWDRRSFDCASWERGLPDLRWDLLRDGGTIDAKLRHSCPGTGIYSFREKEQMLLR